jgi:hypothetical protein
LGWNVVGTALNSRKPGAISKSGLVLKRENHPFKNNVTTEPIAATPSLCILSQNLNHISHGFTDTEAPRFTLKVEFQSPIYSFMYSQKRTFKNRKKELAERRRAQH